MYTYVYLPANSCVSIFLPLDMSHTSANEQLKNEAVSMADVMAPPDSILQSVIGKADGEVMQC